MSEKSYVGLKNRICPICGIQHAFDCGILLDTRMKDNLDKNTVTGYGLCEEHMKVWQDGYVALVEIDPEKSLKIESSTLNSNNAWRTGRIINMKKDCFEEIFNRPVEEPMAFIDIELFDQLQNMPWEEAVE